MPLSITAAVNSSLFMPYILGPIGTKCTKQPIISFTYTAIPLSSFTNMLHLLMQLWFISNLGKS